MIEAHLDARLLGLRVLRVDGTVLLAPGHVVEASRTVRHVPRRTGAPGAAADLAPGAHLAQAARLLASNRARLDGRVPPRLGQAS